MSFNGPILEKWLLSGQATFKNLSVGNAGLTKIPVPIGKTYIITKIEILPYLNVIDNNLANTDTFRDVVQQNLSEILQRVQSQLLFYNSRINSVYNVRNDFSINTLLQGGNTHTAPAINVKKTEIECFHIVEEDSWLFLKFFDFGNQLNKKPNITTDFYQLYFDGTQNWGPNVLYGYFDQYDIIGIGSNLNPAAYQYVPQGYSNLNNNLVSDQFILPSNAWDPITGTQFSSFIPPEPPQAFLDLNFLTLLSIPLYNISIIELNRRLSTEQLL